MVCVGKSTSNSYGMLILNVHLRLFIVSYSYHDLYEINEHLSEDGIIVPMNDALLLGITIIQSFFYLSSSGIFLEQLVIYVVPLALQPNPAFDEAYVPCHLICLFSSLICGVAISG